MRTIVLRRFSLSHATWSTVREETREMKRARLKTRMSLLKEFRGIENFQTIFTLRETFAYINRERGRKNFKGKYFHKNFLLYFPILSFRLRGPQNELHPFSVFCFLSSHGTSFPRDRFAQEFLIDQIKMIKNINNITIM